MNFDATSPIVSPFVDEGQILDGSPSRCRMIWVALFPLISLVFVVFFYFFFMKEFHSLI